MKRKNLLGQKFNHLIVIEDAGHNKSGRTQWLCECDCENHTHIIATSKNLTEGSIKSCGCQRGAKTRGTLRKTNTYNLSGEYGVGYTKEGQEFYFNLEDYDLISKYYWTLSRYGYLTTTLPRQKGKPRKMMLMHRLLLNPPDDMEIDHVNRIRHDNRRCNLRVCTHTENMKNTSRTYIPIKTAFYIENFEFLGLYDSREEAVRAYKDYISENWMILTRRRRRR